ncbi:MAG: hypothetical protein ACQES8_07570 [Thermodesulfobacteriota bacterium]
MLTTKNFFDISSFRHNELFKDASPVWESLKLLKDYMADQYYPSLPDIVKDGEPLSQPVVVFENTFITGAGLTFEIKDVNKGGLRIYKDDKILKGASLIMAGAVLNGSRISIGKGTLVEPGAFLQSPSIIGNNTEVRQGAYIRGYCLAGSRCVIGHTTEVKHSILLDGAKAGHFAYLGDSILGNEVNLGAGTKLANLRFLPGNIQIKAEEKDLDTGLRKCGAIVGDYSQTGCNSVTNPGTLLGKKTLILPNTTAPSGYHKDDTIIR